MTFQELLDLCDGGPFQYTSKGKDTIKNVYEAYLPWFVDYRTGSKQYENNLIGMTENGLTEEEAFFILAYSSSCSKWINRDLRIGRKLQTDCQRAFANSLDQALEKMKSFTGIVYRMDSPPGTIDEILDWFQSNKSKKFSIPYFLSAAREDYCNSKVVWQIQTLQLNSNGKDISRLCQAPLEFEVLFKRGSKFQIVEVKKEMNYVYLRELESDVKIDFDLVGDYYKEEP